MTIAERLRNLVGLLRYGKDRIRSPQEPDRRRMFSRRTNAVDRRRGQRRVMMSKKLARKAGI